MIGEKLGAYTIIEEIGKGGMATVYKAYQENVDRHVALKVIHHIMAQNQQAVQRFQREARLIAKLEHPHIVPIYDFDGANEPPYIVMRYMDSGTLKTVLQHKRLPLEEVSYIVQQVCSALDYAHRQGVIHRDIKPSNIMVDRDGNAFVTDLGIARITSMSRDSDEPITATGTIIGTPDYMAPEQALGDPNVDHRADVYAMGVLLFEMLTGRRPFMSESTTALMIMHMRDQIPTATDVQPSLPPYVDELIFRSMAKRPEDRYSSAIEFSQAVIDVLGPAAKTPFALQIAVRETSETMKISNEGDDEATGARTQSEQHKQVTTLYANLTELEEILLDAVDTEVVQWILQSMFMQLNDVIVRRGGTVYEQTDRSLQALWGVEAIQENDPQNAVMAALEIRDVIEPLGATYIGGDAPPPYQIVINTGPALIQSSEADRQYTVTGQTLTLARRIERSASPGQILITYNTYRLVMGMFTVQPQPPIQMRGRKEQIEVYQVNKLAPRARRETVRGVEGIDTKTIGMEAELKRMQDALIYAMEDIETQVVTIVGEMGVGKSRLAYELRRWVAMQEERVWIVNGRASQQQQVNAGYLMRDFLSYMFKIYDTDTPNQVREKFESGLENLLDGDEKDAIHAADVLARVAGFNFVNNRVVTLLSEENDEERALVYLRRLLNAMTKDATMLLQLEDFQWADDYSLDILNRFVTENTDLRLMVVCLTRPELYERRPGWGEGRDFHMRLDLEPLSKRDTRRLVREILQYVENVPDDLRDLIVERSEGNPYYVEELIKVLIEDGVILKNSDTQWSVQLDKLASARVPASLIGVLQARIDALSSEERLLLQRASVIGRVFWDRSLLALEIADNVPVEAVNDLLEQLRGREMIFVREESAVENSREYIFRHAMLRDVVYESLTYSQRREYHLAAIEWYNRIGVDRPDEYTDLIAHHRKLAQS